MADYFEQYIKNRNKVTAYILGMTAVLSILICFLVYYDKHLTYSNDFLIILAAAIFTIYIQYRIISPLLMKVVSVLFFLITMGCCIVVSGIIFFLLFECKVLHYPAFAYGDLISYKIKAGYFLTLGTLLFFASRALFLFFNTFQLSTKRYKHLVLGNSKEINELRLKSNPHILYNYLHNSYKLLRDDKTDIALEYSDTFNSLIKKQTIFASSEVISLENELQWLQEYLKCEKIRMHQLLNYQINVQTQEIFQQNIPPYILQPVVEYLLNQNTKFEKPITIAIDIKHLKNEGKNGSNIYLSCSKEKKEFLSYKTASFTNWEKRVTLINELKQFNITYHKNTSSSHNIFEINILEI